jgi:hypothetical protein
VLADDLATLALDMLMVKEGKAHGETSYSIPARLDGELNKQEYGTTLLFSE